jgi:hypothetical protein
MPRPQNHPEVFTVFVASAAIFYGAYYTFPTKQAALEFITLRGGILVDR